MRILSCCLRQMRPANEKMVFHNLVFVSIRKTYPMQAYKVLADGHRCTAYGAWGR